jgi:hypothetical protein
MASAVGFGAIEVEGLPELYQALGELDISIQENLKEGLLEGAEPVRRRAEGLAMSEITNMTDHWARMKIGITGRALVYIAPLSRRTAAGSPRPNLSGLLLDQMEDAAVEGETEVLASVEASVGRAIKEAGF